LNPDVFLSLGAPSTPRHEAFVAACEDLLREHGLRPRALGRSEWSQERPLKHIRRVMSECAGTLVLAYERIHVAAGREKRGHPHERELSDVILPSVWNQVEAGMAYEMGHPLLVVVEEGLREEGLLEDGHDWILQRVPLDRAALEGPGFLEAFEQWAQQVRARAALRGPEPEGLMPR
jgi:hypothetical protein